ncbi:MAG: flagellar hook-basal body complex protein FliE [candidate division Zixibacteria bacterium]|nr:flagellar hook-basal body complex protein FliE [candidate division Zixibacteria bacterium]
MNGIIANKINLPSDGLNPLKINQVKPADKGFAGIFKDILTEANSLQMEAGMMQEKFLLGEVQDLHSVMVAAEKASVAFNLVMEIRNKLLEGYQTLLRMPV